MGVDPASAGATGYGVIELLGSRARVLHFGALCLPARTEFDERLRRIHELIAKLLAEFQPDAMAVEGVFAALNVRTALKLSEVRGVVLLAAAQAGIPSHSYSPREVKVSVTGYGAASKQQVQQMIRALLGLRECPESADAADGMAVALCHAHVVRAAERLAASETKLSTAAKSRVRCAAGATKLPSQLSANRLSTWR